MTQYINGSVVKYTTVYFFIDHVGHANLWKIKKIRKDAQDFTGADWITLRVIVHHSLFNDSTHIKRTGIQRPG